MEILLLVDAHCIEDSLKFFEEVPFEESGRAEDAEPATEEVLFVGAHGVEKGSGAVEKALFEETV